MGSISLFHSICIGRRRLKVRMLFGDYYLRVQRQKSQNKKIEILRFITVIAEALALEVAAFPFLLGAFGNLRLKLWRKLGLVILRCCKLYLL